MPLNMPRHTTVQAASRQQVRDRLSWPVSSMESVTSSAVRYQKKVVGALAAHSATGATTTNGLRRNGLSNLTIMLT